MPQLGPESFFYGLPKATLETHGPRPQTLLGSWQACLRSCRPQLGPESFFYGLPKATLETHGPRPQTPLGSWQACLRSCRPQLGPASFFYGLPKATLETHGPRPKPLSAAGRRASSLGLSQATKAPACHVKQPPPPSKPYCVGITPALAKQRPQLGSESFFYAAAWPRKLFLWASEGNVRDPRAPPPNPSRQLAGLPPFLQAAAWPRKLFLWASEGNVRDPRAPPPNPSRQLACHVKQPPPPSKPYCVGITPALAKQRPQLGSESFFYAAAWPRKLFLWASEGNVRDPRAPPPNPSRQLAGLPPCSANRGGKFTPAFVCLESERGVSISDLIRTAHTLGRP